MLLLLFMYLFAPTQETWGPPVRACASREDDAHVRWLLRACLRTSGDTRFNFIRTTTTATAAAAMSPSTARNAIKLPETPDPARHRLLNLGRVQVEATPFLLKSWMQDHKGEPQYRCLWKRNTPCSRSFALQSSSGNCSQGSYYPEGCFLFHRRRHRNSRLRPVSVSLSLSLYVYIYIYMCICI